MSHVLGSGTQIVPGLSILHANHPEDLRELVMAHLRNHPLRPLENEVFLVQSNGMAQWLRQRFAEDDGCGIAAAMDMQMPARFLWQAYRAVLGEEQVAAESPFDKARLTWRLLRLLPECLEDPRFVSLRHYLADADTTDISKRFQLAERLADLFDQYQVYRADWLADWGEGEDVLRDARGQPQPLEDKMLWQPELWRRLLADVPQEEQDSSRAAVHHKFIQALASGAMPLRTLPRRIVVFGISSLPTQILEALEAISRLSQVLICVHNPCRYYWADIIEERQLLRFEHHRHGVRSDLVGLPEEQLHSAVNPLLAAWGKQGRDYIGLLYSYDQAKESTDQIDVFRDRLDPQRPRLLHRVQQGILDLEPPPSSPEQRLPVAKTDDSIRFNLAYSRQREVEILQDHLLDLFSREENALQPRDIIVMVPDITSYAPHIEAVFGRIERDDPRHIPFTIADRPERGQSQLLLALERLLSLPESRFTTSDLMDLLDIGAFRNRFGIQVDELPLLQQWIQASGIRWGLHASHRAGLELPEALEQNSWQFGLRRMLLGYANGSVAWRDVEPFADLGGLEAASAGRLARVLEVLNHYWRQFCEARTPVDWVALLRELVADCLDPTDSEELILLDRFTDLLDEWLEACVQARLQEPLPLNLVRDALLANFEEAGLSQRFLAGMVNFCTLMPMRSIPFKVVCLLGMNDGDYPRQRHPLDFDLMAENYRPGDRTRREDDRYLFLEALLSAREQLYISYVARSERDNSERTPSVLVAQLCDHLDNGWRLEGEAEDSRKLVSHLSVLHPLQPFSRAYFTPERDSRLFSFCREWRQVHEEAAVEESAELPLWQPDEALTLSDLQGFLRRPAELFFRERLHVYYRETESSVEEHEPFLLNSLQMHNLTQELVEQALQVPPDQRDAILASTLKRFERRGLLPLGAQAERMGQTLLDPAQKLLENWDQACRLWPKSEDIHEVHLSLPVGDLCLQLEDWLDDLYRAPGGELVRLERRPSQLYRGKKGNRALLKHHYFPGLWVRHLAANAMGLELASVMVVTDGLHRLAPVPRAQAQEYLVAIAKAWHEGLQTCLPLALKTAMAWLSEPDLETDQLPEKIREVYEGGFNNEGELVESYALTRCWPSLEALWNEDFRRLAKQVYGPLHQALKNLETIPADGSQAEVAHS